MSREKDIAPRYFPHSAVGGVPVEKRLEYPKRLRPSHVMVTGGREGALVSGKRVPMNGLPTDTGWTGDPSLTWKKELQADKTLEDARTQPPFLRQVRPEQRAWARGVMRVEDIERVVYGGPVPLKALPGGKRAAPIDVQVVGNPEVELTVWVADEGAFASITGTVSYIRQIAIGGTGNKDEDAQADKILTDVLGVNEKNNTIENLRRVINSTTYADSMGLIFKPSPQVKLLQPGIEVTLPYYLIGRARRIFPADGRPWRVSSRPTAEANRPADLSFYEFLDAFEKNLTEDRIDAEVRRIVEPSREYVRDVTPFTTIGPTPGGGRISGMEIRTSDPLEGKSEVADALSLMNLYRTAGADFRDASRKSTSVIEEPHDPLSLTQPRRRKRKKAPKDNLQMFNNPTIGGRRYISVSQRELEKIARDMGLSVEQVRIRFPHFITSKEAAGLRKSEAEAASRAQASWGSPRYTAPGRQAPYRRLANPTELEVGDHVQSPADQSDHVVRRVLDDGCLIIQGFRPDPHGGRAKKYFPFRKIGPDQAQGLELVERGFADRMRELKAAGN